MNIKKIDGIIKDFLEKEEIPSILTETNIDFKKYNGINNFYIQLLQQELSTLYERMENSDFIDDKNIEPFKTALIFISVLETNLDATVLKEMDVFIWRTRFQIYKAIADFSSGQGDKEREKQKIKNIIALFEVFLQDIQEKIPNLKKIGFIENKGDMELIAEKIEKEAQKNTF